MRIVLDTNVLISDHSCRFSPSMANSSTLQPCLSQSVQTLTDDKFLACAMAAGVSVIVSGDKDLLDKSGWQDIRVLRPRQFSDEFLSEP